jgi:hypothetical protein
MSDYGLPILPISIKKSKRQEILSQINELENKIKKESFSSYLYKKIEKLKKKRDNDDKEF